MYFCQALVRRRNTFTISHIKDVAFDEYENEYLMSPEEKIQYVKDNIDGETLISPFDVSTANVSILHIPRKGYSISMRDV